jgi:hypothetical protein
MLDDLASHYPNTASMTFIVVMLAFVDFLFWAASGISFHTQLGRMW